MKIAHLVLCHVNTQQVIRLVSVLQHPDADIYVHVDKKVPVEAYLPLAEMPNVFLVKERVSVYWGGYSIVAATLSAFRQILASGINYDFINLLSGQDYPLKPASEVHKFLSDHSGRVFMNVFPEWDRNEEHDRRLQQYYFAAVNVKGKYTAERIARIIKPRKFPEWFMPMGRSQWFTIPMECAAYIVKFVKEHSNIVKLFRYMWAPDELFFQSILYNSPYCKAITNDNLRYVDWSERLASPKVLTMADADTLVRSGQLFARKFDMNIDGEILDYLDARVTTQ